MGRQHGVSLLSPELATARDSRRRSGFMAVRAQVAAKLRLAEIVAKPV
jgi:hypothetical protein